jgi:hypothetical protein
MKGFWILPILDFRFWMKGLVAPLFPVTFSPINLFWILDERILD